MSHLDDGPGDGGVAERGLVHHRRHGEGGAVGIAEGAKAEHRFGGAFAGRLARRARALAPDGHVVGLVRGQRVFEHALQVRSRVRVGQRLQEGFHRRAEQDAGDRQDDKKQEQPAEQAKDQVKDFLAAHRSSAGTLRDCNSGGMFA